MMENIKNQRKTKYGQAYNGPNKDLYLDLYDDLYDDLSEDLYQDLKKDLLEGLKCKGCTI